jgi:hypothetical protein
LPSLICHHPFTDNSLNHRLRFGVHYIQQAIEAELSPLLERFENVKTLHGQRAVRNGYLPAREVLTAAGAIPVKVPKVRDRSATTHTPDLTVSPSNSQLHFSPHYLSMNKGKTLGAAV